jgi:hypothetical protein
MSDAERKSANTLKLTQNGMKPQVVEVAAR